MLHITIPAGEEYDPIENLFIPVKEQSLTLEHSLVSISKWESKWNKPFLSKTPKTYAETIDYIRCMTLTQNVDPSVYYRLTNENIEEINKYIDAPMTATTFGKEQESNKHSREIITAEIIYYWMVALQIPFECQKWHFNRLMTLIRVCNIKNSPPKKMSKRDLMKRNHSLNAARRSALKSNG